MTSHSHKRKLDDTSANSKPSAKRHKNDESSETESDMIPVKFPTETREYKKEELVVIEFCRVKLQRWSPNIDKDESKDQNQYFIDLSLFPSLTATIFTAIIHLQIIFNKSSNNNNNKIIYKAAQSLLSDHIKINDLPQFLEACKILLVKDIFNKEIFKHYFDEYHTPIPIEALIQLQNAHQSDAFLVSILSVQLPLYNIMNNYSTQQKVYDRYNKIGSVCFPYSRDVSPNGEHAVRYVMEQIQLEKNRERTRFFLSMNCYQPDDEDYEVYDDYCEYEDYQYYGFEQECDDIPKRYRGRHHGVDDGGTRYYMPDSVYEEQQKQRQTLKENIDDGLCAAFDDMIKYGANLESFLELLFDFLDTTFLAAKEVVDPDNWRVYSDDSTGCPFGHMSSKGIVMDRSHFCFYGLAYIAHGLFILYLQKNDAIIKFLVKNKPNHGKYMYNLFHRILDHNVTRANDFWSSKKMKILITQRIGDCAKYKSKFNTLKCLNSNYLFPHSVFAHVTKYVSDAEWIIDNCAMKLNNSDCRKAMQSVLEKCMERMDEINISESLNNKFQQYLGAKIIHNKP